jgi:hypothetical protein
LTPIIGPCDSQRLHHGRRLGQQDRLDDAQGDRENNPGVNPAAARRWIISAIASPDIAWPPIAVNGLTITICLTLVALFGSLGAHHEDLSSGVDDVGGDGLQLVDAHDAGDLGHEAFDEAEVAAGDLRDGVGCFGMVGVVGVEW